MKPAQRRWTKAFTLIELMVVISIISVLASILLPAVGGLLEQARLASCQRRMGAYAMAFHSYRNDNQNKLPALFRTGEPGAPVGAATIWGAPDERLGSSNAGAAREVRAALGSNAMQNLWLIIDGAYMGGGEETFRCPGDSGFKGRTVPEGTGKFGWTDARNFSYGIQFPYAALGPPALPDAEGGYPELPKDTRTWNFADPNGFVQSREADEVNKAMYPENCIYLADRNPRRAWNSTYAANSNHEEGVAYVEKGGSCNVYKGADGKAGIGRDDIYQPRKGEAGMGLPFVSQWDSQGLAKYPCTDTVIWPLDMRKPGR